MFHQGKWFFLRYMDLFFYSEDGGDLKAKHPFALLISGWIIWFIAYHCQCVFIVDFKSQRILQLMPVFLNQRSIQTNVSDHTLGLTPTSPGGEQAGICGDPTSSVRVTSLMSHLKGQLWKQPLRHRENYCIACRFHDFLGISSENLHPTSLLVCGCNLEVETGGCVSGVCSLSHPGYCICGEMDYYLRMFLLVYAPVVQLHKGVVHHIKPTRHWSHPWGLLSTVLDAKTNILFVTLTSLCVFQSCLMHSFKALATF